MDHLRVYHSGFLIGVLLVLGASVESAVAYATKNINLLGKRSMHVLGWGDLRGCVDALLEAVDIHAALTGFTS